jgi:osmotically-inducible protein OsmY
MPASAMLDASDIEVEVSGSEVTLSGEVGSRSDKRRAEDIAEDISGVSQVQNNLRVRRSDEDTSGAVG